MDDDFWERVSYIQMSKNRRKVLKLMSEAEKPLTPTELSNRMEVVVKSASRAVRQLSEKGLVTCINPDAPRHRRYRITDQGSKVLEELEREQS